MAINTQTIRIDLNPGKTIPVAFVHQNDTNRQLTFQLYNNGEAFTPSSTTVKFAYKSPIVNGRYSVITGSQMASGTVSGNTVTVTLPAQYTQVSGVGLLTMILTTSGNTLRPVNIKFVCQGSADGDDTILAASDWPEGLYDYMDNWLAENEPTEIANLKSDFSDVEDWLGYPTNFFNARDLTASNTTNWSIDSATKTSVTITHKNTFSTGYPIAILDLPSGDYIFHADYTNSATAFSLQTDGSWVKALTDGAEFTIDSAKENAIYFANDTVGTYKITEISAVAKEKSSGKIHTLEDATSINAAKIADLEEEFNSIATPSIGPMDGIETQARAIRANGDIYTAGSNNYRISRFSVSQGKTYWITATTNWGNALWCFYDSNDSVVEVGTVSASGSDDTTIIDRETTAPVGSAFLVIAYNPTVKNGAVKTQAGYTLGAVWRGKKWVCVGDSLTAENIRTTKHYFDYVADATGITAVNMGYSGSGYARLANENHAFYQRISSCPTDADVVTIFGSFNDLGAGLPLGTVNDTGTDTLAGCINTTITNLQTVIPLVNLGIVAPTPWATAVPATSGEDFNYVEMIKAICAKRSIPYLDLWRESNLRPWDADFRALAYSKDEGNGTHPDENGHKLIAPRFKAFLETLLM